MDSTITHEELHDWLVKHFNKSAHKRVTGLYRLEMYDKDQKMISNSTYTCASDIYAKLGYSCKKRNVGKYLDRMIKLDSFHQITNKAVFYKIIKIS